MSSDMKVFLANDHRPSSGSGWFVLLVLLALGAGGWWYFAGSTAQTSSTNPSESKIAEAPLRVVHKPGPEPEAAAKPVPAKPAGPVLLGTFANDADGFEYVDDVFRATTQPQYAAGARISDAFDGGGLSVRLGGRDSKTIAGMSGGWRRSFELAAPTPVTLQFRYNMTQAPDYEADEFSQVLCTVGKLQPGFNGDFVVQFTGNGNGGKPPTTGWQNFRAYLGQLPAGRHELTIGVYNNKKTAENEWTEIKIDDVRVDLGEVNAPVEHTSPPVTQKPTVPSEKQDLTF